MSNKMRVRGAPVCSPKKSFSLCSRTRLSRSISSAVALSVLGLSAAPTLHAQEEVAPDGGLRLEEIIVTALKKGTGESVQDVPLSITAFDGDLLDKLQVRNIQGLSYSAPNTAIDSSGTVKGLANFSIRGLGSTSSVPTIDPTVGTFVDGVYLGTNYGVILDNFDLEGIELLRGPQGLLFGRNVTGGAVLVKTRRPSHEYSAKVKAGVETGLQTTVSGSVTGSLVEDKLSGKLVALYKDDQGYFTNIANGNDNFGGDETSVVRGALAYTPTENLEFLLRAETGRIDGDGPITQNPAFQDGSHDVNLSNEGLTDTDWEGVTLESNLQVGFGDGTITSILAYRAAETESITSVDARPTSIFDIGFYVDQDQFSAETRYTGTFNDGRWTATAGLYFFTQDIIYREFRDVVIAGAFSEFGGQQSTNTYGVFTSNDFALNDDLTLTLGARFTFEEKDVETTTGNPGAAVQPCVFASTAPCTVTNFVDDDDWQNLSPKVGLQWQVSDSAQLYGSWSQGFRSGGYTLRINSPAISPGPVDEEQQTAIELGFKGDWLDGRLRTNLALFSSEIEDVQRVITQSDPNNNLAIIQTAANTADATIEGIELEVQAIVSDSLFVSGFLGILDGEYDSIANDLTGDGVVDQADFDLRLPLLADLSWGLSANYTHQLPGGELGFLLSYSFRDDAESTDNNDPGTLQTERDIVDASISYTSERYTISLYGKNLADEVITQTLANFGGLTAPGNFQTIRKGRLFGLEVTYNF